MKPFEGFTAETIDFLWELRMNNSREWMEENRDRYKRVLKEPFDSLAAALVAESIAFGGREMKCSVSRINRDIRFSKDKSPYRASRWVVLYDAALQGTAWKERPSFYFELNPEGLRMGEQMKIIYELSWLWETLGIALMAAVVCVVGAMLICRAKKKKLSKKSTVVIGIAAFIIAIVAVIEIARIPMPL